MTIKKHLKRYTVLTGALVASGALLSLTTNAQINPNIREIERVDVLSNPNIGQTRETDESKKRRLTTDIFNVLDQYYVGEGIESGRTVGVSLEVGNRKVLIKDISGNANSSSTSFSSNSTGARLLDPGSIQLNGSPVTTSPMTINTCANSTITGIAKYTVFGFFTSRVELYRDGTFVTADSEDSVGWGGNFDHGFSIPTQIQSGDYTLKHYIVPGLFNGTRFKSGPDKNFTVNNTANCAKVVEYQVHAKNLFWMDWVSNGSTAGTTGQNRRIEAVKIRTAGDALPGLQICYAVEHSKTNWRGKQVNRTWSNESCDGSVAGTTGDSRRIEKIKIRLANAPAGCAVNYRVHKAFEGWSPWRTNNAVAGNGRRVEAVQVKLTNQCL